METNNFEFVDKTSFEIEYKDLSVINGKSIKKVEAVSESTESSGISIYKIFREDDVVLGTLYIRNGEKGSTGNGILSIEQTKTSNEDKGENVLTIKDTNGNIRTFTVRNGSKGSQGDKGDTGIGIYSMEQTKVSTEDNGENIFTFTTSDGNTKQFSIRNGSKGSQGEPFQIKKVYSSISEMNSGYSTDGLPIGSFVIIDTGSVEDSDTGKLYVKSDSGYSYITDLSGSQGIQGPQGIQGIGITSIEQTKTSTEDGGTNEFTVTLSNGTKYVLTNRNGSKGNQGNTGPAVPLEQTTGTSTDSAMSQNAVTEALGTKAPQSHSHVKEDITDFAHNHDDRYYTENEIDTKVNQLKSDLVAKANVLSYEEIMASTDLTNKVASAESVNNLVNKLPKTLIFQLSAGTPTKTYTLEPNINYLLINADNPLGVWILAQSGYERMIGTIIDGGWDGATFSIDKNTLTVSKVDTSSSSPSGTFYYLIPLESSFNRENV